MALTPEGKVKAAVKRYLVSHGMYYYMPMSNGMGRVGAPDFIICFQGQFIAVETKAPGKISNTTPNQERELEAIHNAGGIAIVIDDVKQLSERLTPMHI
jgi:hypothetical protein